MEPKKSGKYPLVYVVPKFADPVPISPESIKSLAKTHSSLLETTDTASFNIFDFAGKIDKPFVLALLAYHIFQKNDAFTVLDQDAFYKLMPLITSWYTQGNPYHNYLHAADVLQLTHYFLNHCGIKSELGLDQIEVTAMLLAALVHDLKHPGVYNSFLENILHELALTYNGQSILENYHVAEFFKEVFRDETIVLFKDVALVDFKRIRKIIVATILGTDMAKHNHHIQALQNSVEKDEKGKWVLKKQTPENDPKMQVLISVLHAADIGTATRDLPVFKGWTKRVHDEFFAQGDKEKAMGLIPSLNCDREKTDIHKGQIEYIDRFVLPLYETISKIMPKVSELVERVKKTREKWEAKSE